LLQSLAAMTAKSIDAQIVHSLPLLGKDEKSSLLKVIQSFLKLKDNPAVAKEPPFDIDEYNREIDEAEAEMERGEFYTHEEVMAMFKERWNKEASSK
jgi:hypothetical protein